MTKIFNIVSLVLLFCGSHSANGTAAIEIPDCDLEASTEIRVKLETYVKELDRKEFNPAECFDKVWGIIND